MPHIITHVGVDVSKDRLDIHIHPAGEAFAVPNTTAGHRRLIDRLRTLAGLESICMEASGGYEASLLRSLSAARLPARLVAPDQVRALARALRLKAKTDRIDAALIARFAATIDGAPHRGAPARDRLAEAVRARRQLVDQIAVLKTRIAQTADPGVRRILGQAQADMARRVRRIEALIDRRTAADADLARRDRLIRSIPGLGRVAAFTLLARMPELGTLSPKAAAALVGVAPFDRQSGAAAGTKAIHGGRGDVRRVLYMAALVAPRQNPELAAFRARLKRAGKPPKLILVAVINKLIRIANAVIERGTPFIPQT